MTALQPARNPQNSFMRHLIHLLCTLCLIPFAAADPRPNIVVILADDLGFSDLGCYGSTVPTPHLDALAANGLRFTDVHNIPRCVPSRAALLTGLHPHQAGVGLIDRHARPRRSNNTLNENCVTIAEVLRAAGYTTLMTGKWHVGDDEGHHPPDRGFDRYWGSPRGGGFYFKDAMLRLDREIYFNREKIDPPDDLYVTDDFTDHAIDFVTEAVTETKKPFFLFIAHIAPHWPLQAKPEEIARFEGHFDHGWDVERQRRFANQKELGIIPAHSALSERDPQAKPWEEKTEKQRADLAHRMEIYTAQVDALDRNVGKLVARLKELGRFKNTLIVFLSDNGCSAEGGPGGFNRGEEGAPLGTALSYASAGLEWANVSNTPFRKFKISTFQGGTATPFIAHWPDGIEARGEIRRQPGHIIDLMPTFIEISGATYPENFAGNTITPMQGQSLAPFFRGDAKPPARDFFWKHLDNKAVRRGHWRAVRSDNPPWQLFDLSVDPTETTDLATE